MAIGTPTTLTSGSDTTDSAASYTTASITPTAGAVIFCGVLTTVGSGTAGTVTLTHGSITFNTLTSTTFNGTGWRISLVQGVVNGSPSAGAITITPSAATQTGVMWVVQQWTGVDTATPVPSSNYKTGSGTSTGPSTTALSAFGSSANAVVAFVAASSPGSDTYTAGTGFTLLGNPSAMATPTARIVGEYQLANDTTPDMTISVSRAWGMVAAEVKDSGLALAASGSEYTVASGTATYSGVFNAFRGLVLVWP